jgi:hypothetical protein
MMMRMKKRKKTKEMTQTRHHCIQEERGKEITKKLALKVQHRSPSYTWDKIQNKWMWEKK